MKKQKEMHIISNRTLKKQMSKTYKATIEPNEKM